MKAKDDFNLKKSKNYLEVLAQIVVVASLALFISTLFFDRFTMKGSSMAPLIEKQDLVLINRASYLVRSPKRFDLVYVQIDENTYTIKRIIGMPGEVVYIHDGNVYINGEKLENPFLNDQILNGGIASNPLTLYEDEYFVLGDSTAFSEDSRSKNIGAVHFSKFHGKPWSVIFPMNRLGFIH